jgi:acylphosphatase
MKTVVLRITGIVQGVGYRYFVKTMAERCGVKGYVENRGDGTLEIAAQGEEKGLALFLEEARAGPSFAHIGTIDEDEEEMEEFDEFLER